MKLTLTSKIVGLVLIGLLMNALLIAAYSERELEDAMLDQAKRQAVVYLIGLERQIRELPDPGHHPGLRHLLLSAMEDSRREHFDFVFQHLYLYDGEGRIWANTAPQGPGFESLDVHHRQVLLSGKAYVSEQLEWMPQPDGEAIPLLDVIVPLRIQDRVVAGIEAEINLRETLRLIQERDGAYERDLLILLVVSGILLFVFLGSVLHRLVIRPVGHFERVTRAIADGQLTERVRGALAEDELGQLGGSINVMAENISRLIQEQEEAYLQILRSLAKALEAKDACTAGHSGRVTRYAVQLGRFLGLSSVQVQLLERGALMHDLGKIGIADAVLNKPGALTDEEFAIVQQHPGFTANIIHPLSHFKELAEIAAWHHERWDGGGYPDGLRGEEISLLARIVAIADTWDAMTGDRIYRQGMSQERALAILEREQESGQWDPHLVREFVRMVRTSGVQQDS